MVCLNLQWTYQVALVPLQMVSLAIHDTIKRTFLEGLRVCFTKSLAPSTFKTFLPRNSGPLSALYLESALTASALRIPQLVFVLTPWRQKPRLLTFQDFFATLQIFKGAKSKTEEIQFLGNSLKHIAHGHVWRHIWRINGIDSWSFAPSFLL